jgi:hypothetical protein
MYVTIYMEVGDQLDSLKVRDIDTQSELLIVRDDARGEASVVCP